MEIRVIINQIGVAMELHGYKSEPITIALIRYDELAAFRNELGTSNPDMRHAAIGQIAVLYANRLFQNIAVNQRAWMYNASENSYS